jgi:dihydroxyacetone kinase-like predicted kinase
VPEVGPRREGRLALAGAALAALEASRTRIDDLNVYPVPDGDTGTNMTLTVRAVVDALERDPEADIGRAILMGARGNSGVILSQLVTGALRALSADATLDPPALAGLLREASDAGYAAVREPQEGTILTVARSLAERAEAIAGDGLTLEDALADLLAAGEVALAGTTEQLDVLKQAGVVDAGGAGLLEIVRGIARMSAARSCPSPRRSWSRSRSRRSTWSSRGSATAPRSSSRASASIPPPSRPSSGSWATRCWSSAPPGR